MNPTDRREFIKKTAMMFGLWIGQPFIGDADALSDGMDHSKALWEEEDYWGKIRGLYNHEKGIIYLNNAGMSSGTLSAYHQLNALQKYNFSAPLYHLGMMEREVRAMNRISIAELCGATAHEIAFQRNATEALVNLISGIQLQKGDEVILSEYDYPSMLNAWKYRVQKEGIVLRWLGADFPWKDSESIVQAYLSKLTPQTKIVHLTHVNAFTGEILPVKEIANSLKIQNPEVEILLDAAQSLGHIEFSLKELDVDYAGASLHKWLGAPAGTGMLYIQKDKIKKVMPLFPGPVPGSGSIQKFELQGTTSFPIEFSVIRAIDDHLSIGTKRKEERLRFLSNYWTSKLRECEAFELHTPLEVGQYAGIITFSLKGIEVQELEYLLLHQYGIFAKVVYADKLKGIRISPQVYTSLEELDILVQAILKLSQG